MEQFMKYKMSELGKSLFGFTLTEVLIATGIVGIIAALVLPALVTHFRDEVLTHQLRRQMTAIKTAIDNLVVTENKANFGETMMYTTSTSPDYDTTSGEFIKKYLRVSKYYGDFTKNKDTILKECFADKYYEFSGNDKKEYDIKTQTYLDSAGNTQSLVKGACAKLKNGTSICLTPQVGQSAVYGIIDLNGPKGPNVFGKDFIVLSGANKISPVTFTAYDPTGESTESVATTDKPEITPDPDNPCEIGDYSEDCCKYYLNKGLITSTLNQECCDNSVIAPLAPACAKEIDITVNLYPANCRNGDSTCKVYINASQTVAKINGKTDPLPAGATPPDITLYCEGKEAGSMSGANLKNAIESSKSNDYYYFTKNVNSFNTNATCGFSGAHYAYGVRPNYSSVTYKHGVGKNYSYGGYNWSINYF